MTALGVGDTSDHILHLMGPRPSSRTPSNLGARALAILCLKDKEQTVEPSGHLGPRATAHR